MIQNKLLFFSSWESFDAKLKAKEISDASIAFIVLRNGNNLVWTHNKLFGLTDDFLNTIAGMLSTLAHSEYMTLYDTDIKDYIARKIKLSEESTVRNIEKAKGYFTSFQSLTSAYPSPEAGDWAIVADESGKWFICNCDSPSVWNMTQEEYEAPEIDLSEYAKRSDLPDLDDYVTESEFERKLKEIRIPADIATKTDLVVYATKSEVGDLEERVNAVESVIGTDVEEVALKYREIEEFLDGLGDNVLEDIVSRINNCEDLIEDESTRAINAETSLSHRVTNLENNQHGGDSDGIHHAIITKKQYDALDTHDDNTIYFIIQGDTWVFGDSFPITF